MRRGHRDTAALQTFDLVPGHEDGLGGLLAGRQIHHDHSQGIAEMLARILQHTCQTLFQYLPQSGEIVIVRRHGSAGHSLFDFAHGGCGTAHGSSPVGDGNVIGTSRGHPRVVRGIR